MRVQLILPLLLIAVNGRPQTSPSNSTSEAADWKPIETESQSQRLRYNAQLREIQNYYRNFVPINYYTSPTGNTYRANGNPITPKAFNNTVSPRRKIQIKYKIANITSIKEQAKINRNKNKIQRPKPKPKPSSSSSSPRPNNNKNPTNSIQSDHKNWPNGELHTLEDFANYDKYITSTTVAPQKNKKPSIKKPEIHQIFTKVSENPIKSNNNKWFEIKVRPPPSYTPTTEINIQSLGGSIPIDIIENSNPFPVKIPSTNIDDQLTVNIPTINVPNIQIPTANEIINNNNKVHIGTTVHLKPETESDESLKPINGLSNNCPEITITSNAVYNKEVCPDLDITINNHFQTNTNVFTDPPLVEEPVELEEDLESIEEDYPEDNLEEPEIEPAVEEEEEVLAEDGLGESAASSGQQGSSGGSQGSNNNRPQLPNLPGLPQNDNDSNDDSESFLDTGLSILGLLNPFNYPLISLVIAPLALILTGSLGLTTFFVPWTLFPTVFLSRKAKHLSPEESDKPDGWFWHNTYKTWVNFSNEKGSLFSESDRAFKDSLPDLILRLIMEFDDKYYNSSLSKSWKRRKKS